MIRASGLSRSFDGLKAVEDVSFEVGTGEIFALLGPNGAGKTTTVRMLCCLIRPTKGSASVGGFDLSDPAALLEIRRRVGLLPESPGLYERLSAYRNLDFHARLYGMPSVRRASNIEKLLRMLDVWERRDDPVATFSKGMRQKIAIARALVHDPDYVFLDEPTASLDPEASITVRDFVRALRAEGRTFLINTHNLDEAERLATRIGILRQRLLAVGSAAELRALVGARRTAVILRGEAAPLLGGLADAGFSGASAQGNRLLVPVADAEKENPRIVRALATAGADIVELLEERASLEAVYLKLVGGAA